MTSSWDMFGRNESSSGSAMSDSNGVYRTPLLQNRIPEPEPVNRMHSDSALAAAHWDGRLNCRLAIDIGANWGK